MCDISVSQFSNSFFRGTITIILQENSSKEHILLLLSSRLLLKYYCRIPEPVRRQHARRKRGDDATESAEQFSEGITLTPGHTCGARVPSSTNRSEFDF